MAVATMMPAGAGGSAESEDVAIMVSNRSTTGRPSQAPFTRAQKFP